VYHYFFSCAIIHLKAGVHNLKIVILDGYTTNPGDLSFKRLERRGEVVFYERTPADKIIERAKGAEIIITNKTPLSAQTLSQLPECKYIGLFSTGYDVVDLDYTDNHGIVVSNVPSYSTEAVAQMTFAHILAIYNRVEHHSERVHAGDWVNGADFCFWNTPLHELMNKTIGLYGFGRIAQATAKIALAFKMNVIAFSRHPKDFEGVEFVSQDELFAKSDILSFHVPLTPDTENLVNRQNIDKMKNGAVIINTSRGKIINEKDLSEALNSRKISYAGVDVLSVEPPKADNPLLNNPYCIITPHIAWAAKETRKRLLDVVADNLDAFLSGNPQNQVHKEK
jgi:glycerate dehydrogenase